MIFFYFAEIRYRFGYLICSFLITFFACYFYSLQLIYLFARPFLHSKHHFFLFDKGFIFTNLTEAFHTTLKICFVWSFVFIIPLFFYQFWCFFAPTWYLFERKNVVFYIFSALLLNFLGTVCFYFLILPQFLDFLLNFKVDSPLFTIQLEARIDSYVKTSTGVFLIVQSIFQTPLFLYFLHLSDYIDSTFLSLNRKVFVLFLLLLSALVTPPDPLTECCIFLLFWFFFEFLIWIGLKKTRNQGIPTQKPETRKQKPEQ